MLLCRFEGTDRNNVTLECRLQRVLGAPAGPAGVGDACDDTPPMFLEHSRSCDAPEDSCPNMEGNDPQHNVMNYMKDECRLGFTRDQTSLMKDSWKQYRVPGMSQLCPFVSSRMCPYLCTHQQLWWPETSDAWGTWGPAV